KPAPGDSGGGSFILTSSTLKMGDAGGLVFPASASAPMNVSPELAWTGAPPGTMSFALSLFDATAQNTHWILWDIAPTETMLPANLPRGAMPTMPPGASQKSAFGGTPGYEGPGGATINTYEFELWALNVAKLPMATASQTLNQMHTTGLAMYKIGS